MFQSLGENTTSDPPVVYLPGIEGSGALAAQFLLGAENVFNVTRLHYPGHNRMSLEEMADGCVSALGENGNGSAIWLGDSFGSAVALTIALRHPRATRGLILAGGLTRAPGVSRTLAAARMWDMLPSDWRNSLLRRRLMNLVRKHPARLLRSVADDFLANGQMDYVSWRMRLLAAFDVRPYLDQIDVPVLYLGGEDDGIVETQEEARIIRERVTEGRTFLFPGCGHFVLGERADECLELIGCFVLLAKRVAA